MTILVKNKHTLEINGFKFKCSIGEKGSTYKKKEGDKKTPKGLFLIGNLYYRSDRILNPTTKLKKIKINNKMGWCDDTLYPKYYNKLIKIDNTIKHEKLFRKDHKYDLLILIKYNYLKPILGKGSCIFLHLTNTLKPTSGCIALKKKDFIILLKLIKRTTKIKIY